MGTLADLKKSLLDMSPDELRERIRFIREDRRISKQADKAPKAKRVAKAVKTKSLISSLTAAQRKELLAAFTKGENK